MWGTVEGVALVMLFQVRQQIESTLPFTTCTVGEEGGGGGSIWLDVAIVLVNGNEELRLVE